VNTIGQRTSLVVQAILFSGLVTVLPATGYGQTPIRGQTNLRLAPVWGWPYDPTLMPYWGYWYSPCYPFASCWAYQQFQILERRQERWQELGREQQPPPVGIQTWGGFPAARGRAHATTPSDGADVQPDYAGSGQIQDQYQRSGDFLPEFLDGRVRPRAR
jgi:hypothetical protein